MRAARRANRGRLRLRQPADPTRLRELRRRIQQWAAQHNLPADTLVDLQLVLGEAASNCVEHAYRDGPGRNAAAATVDIELELRRAGGEPVVAVSVTDHGRWRPIPMRKQGRGRGLAIIAQLSRDLRIAPSTDGTRLTCHVPLRPLLG